MTFTTRLGLFLCITLFGVLTWHWNVAADSARDMTHLAVQQFQNNDAVPAQLQEAGLAQNWTPFLWPAIVLVIGILLFWEDAERWLHRNDDVPV